MRRKENKEAGKVDQGQNCADEGSSIAGKSKLYEFEFLTLQCESWPGCL